MGRLASILAAGLMFTATVAPAAEPTLTGKERLGPKSSDQRRVDDCKVPPALRDPDTPRPADCAADRKGATAEPATGGRD